MKNKNGQMWLIVLGLALGGCLDVGDKPVEDDYTEAFPTGVDIVDELGDPGLDKGLIATDCSTAQKRQVEAARRRVREVFKTVMSNCSKEKDPLFSDYFGDASRSAAQAGYNKLRSFFETHDLKVACPNSGCVGIAKAWLGRPDGTIYLCPSFFDPNRTGRRPNALVHEVAHMVLRAEHGTPPGRKGTDNAYSYGGYFEKVTKKTFPYLDY